MKHDFSNVGTWLRTFARALLFVVPVCGLLLFIEKLDLSGIFQQPARANMTAQDKRFPAKDLSGGVAWLNIKKPLSLEDLRGRIVLLDFWTLCCINCIHVLPDLAKLEAKYPGILVVLGIHTPKFENEKKTESIAKAILRYDIRHPIINDAETKSGNAMA